MPDRSEAEQYDRAAARHPTTFLIDTREEAMPRPPVSVTDPTTGQPPLFPGMLADARVIRLELPVGHLYGYLAGVIGTSGVTVMALEGTPAELRRLLHEGLAVLDRAVGRGEVNDRVSRETREDADG